MKLTLLLLSVFPPLFLLFLIYINDKIEKESKRLIVKLFFLGIISTLPIAMFETVFGYILPFEDGSVLYHFIDVFFVIALFEEGIKYLITKNNTWKNKEFNYTFDGIVYACSVSLGFATLENIMYIVSSFFAETNETTFDSFFLALLTGVLRMIFSIPLHFSCGVIMGFFYGNAKYYSNINMKSKAKIHKMLALFLPLFGHGLYDFGLFATQYASQSFLTAFMLDIAAIILIVIAKSSNRFIPPRIIYNPNIDKLGNINIQKSAVNNFQTSNFEIKNIENFTPGQDFLLDPNKDYSRFMGPYKDVSFNKNIEENNENIEEEK